MTVKGKIVSGATFPGQDTHTSKKCAKAFGVFCRGVFAGYGRCGYGIIPAFLALEGKN
jgi:hypothetical protein